MNPNAGGPTSAAFTNPRVRTGSDGVPGFLTDLDIQDDSGNWHRLESWQWDVTLTAARKPVPGWYGQYATPTDTDPKAVQFFPVGPPDATWRPVRVEQM